MAVRAGHKVELDEFEARLEDLRRKFDMYFHGSPEQRMPPTTTQAQIGGELRRLREDEVGRWNTQDRFRFSQIFARYVSLDRMWARTMRQIEDGTWKRDKFKVAQMKKKDVNSQTGVAQRPEGISGLEPLSGLDVDVGSFEDESALASRPQPKQVPRPVVTAAGAGGNGMSDQKLKALYDVYMQAKKRTGESSSLTMDALKKQIEKQIPQIKAKHKCENVDFKVVLKDGKAMLKAVPK
jgi:hypothetical protein